MVEHARSWEAPFDFEGVRAFVANEFREGDVRGQSVALVPDC